MRAVSVSKSWRRGGVTRMLRGLVSGPASGPVMIPLHAITPATMANAPRSARNALAGRGRIRSSAPWSW